MQNRSNTSNSFETLCRQLNKMLFCTKFNYIMPVDPTMITITQTLITKLNNDFIRTDAGLCYKKKPFGWKSIITSSRWQTNHCLPLIYGTNPRMSRYCSMNGNSTYRLRKTAPRASSRTPWCEPKEEDEGKLIDIGWLVTKLVIRTQFG